MTFSKLNISAFLAILFHVSGVIGILFSPYSNWFIQNTPLNLLLMAGLLIWNQEKINKGFLVFTALCFITGMVTEMIGVNTGLLFGNYTYGTVMGIKWLGVPVLIGINWFVVVFCCLVLMEKLHQWVKDKYTADGLPAPPIRLETISVIADGAIMATCFDWLMEPVAVKLGFWQWHSETIPSLNYACWFLISCGLIAVSRKLDFSKTNTFAVHLLVIQTLFFLTLSLFL